MCVSGRGGQKTLTVIYIRCDFVFLILLIIVQRYTEFGTERRLVFNIYRVEHGLGEAEVA